MTFHFAIMNFLLFLVANMTLNKYLCICCLLFVSIIWCSQDDIDVCILHRWLCMWFSLLDSLRIRQSLQLNYSPLFKKYFYINFTATKFYLFVTNKIILLDIFKFNVVSKTKVISKLCLYSLDRYLLIAFFFFYIVLVLWYNEEKNEIVPTLI